MRIWRDVGEAMTEALKAQRACDRPDEWIIPPGWDYDAVSRAWRQNGWVA
jgi:hypothetical protein